MPIGEIVHVSGVQHEVVREVIYAAIGEAGSSGATFREIAAATGLDPVQVERRLSAMGERGLIERRFLGYGQGRDIFTACYEKRRGCSIWRLK